MLDQGFSDASLALTESITHGAKAKIDALNRHLEPNEQVIDLSIGTLDLPADPRIDEGVREFIRHNAEAIHAFAPVKGFAFLRKSLAAKIKRLHAVEVDANTELIVTPGGIKGALTVMFHTFINPGDEALIPVPNWPHYADMLRLHRAVPRFIAAQTLQEGLSPHDLEAHISDKTKLLLLGDCINPTGKVYSSAELEDLARVVASQNVRRAANMQSPIHVLFDCPYEAHVIGPRAVTFAMIEVDIPGHGPYSMRQCTSTLTGPGKTYGMHGDRIGYVWAAANVIEMAARVQVNTNSFASTYAQVATHFAVQEVMDDVMLQRAREARANLHNVLHRLEKIDVLAIAPPEGGYFLFVDFSHCAGAYKRVGHERAEDFLLEEARVGAIGGTFFGPADDDLRHFVRLNCGRSAEQLRQACERIENAISRLGLADVPMHEVPARMARAIPT
jgi:aspartate aminotransferase